MCVYLSMFSLYLGSILLVSTNENMMVFIISLSAG